MWHECLSYLWIIFWCIQNFCGNLYFALGFLPWRLCEYYKSKCFFVATKDVCTGLIVCVCLLSLTFIVIHVFLLRAQVACILWPHIKEWSKFSTFIPSASCFPLFCVFVLSLRGGCSWRWRMLEVLLWE